MEAAPETVLSHADGSVSVHWTAPGPAVSPGKGAVGTSPGAGSGAPGQMSPASSEARRDEFEVRVSFDLKGERVVGVQLVSPAGITPTLLQRAPWRSVLTLAGTARRALAMDDDRAGQELFEMMVQARRGKAPKPWRIEPRKRPGPKGHDDAFYSEIAQRYVQLIAEGVKDPTKTIADERLTARSTAAGWVRKARARGFLPVGRPGKAG